MKKLANKTTAWKDANGHLHKLEKDAKMSTAAIKLKDLANRVSHAINNSVAKGINAPFLAAASWAKENPELVRMLVNYKSNELDIPAGVPLTTTHAQVEALRGAGVIPPGVLDEDIKKYLLTRKHIRDLNTGKLVPETYMTWARTPVEVTVVSTEPVKGEDK